jgi:hypothetical protein
LINGGDRIRLDIVKTVVILLNVFDVDAVEEINAAGITSANFKRLILWNFAIASV